jgi:anti-sigma regulatory factor (Ser/Thr protein kinase)
VSPHASRALEPAAGYRHEAFLWRTLDGFVGRTVPFVRDAVRADEPVMVAVVEDRWRPLRAALGPLAGRVRHVDMERLGKNPARIIPAWRDFVDEHAAGGRPMRGIGEPIWAGRRGAELAECQIHEALLNVALPAPTPLWLLCPYDETSLPPDVIDEARRSHPIATEQVAVPGRPAPSGDSGHGDGDGDAGDGDGVRVGYAGDPHLRALCEQPLAPAGAPVRTAAFGPGDLAGVRALVAAAATAARMARSRVDDLTMAVNELAANSIDHGGGAGVLRLWAEPGALLCEVQDAGRITDPLVGRRSPRADQVRGRGVWMVHQLCDLVQIRSSAAGTVVRVHTWL